jgi:hypothetical protein
VQGIVVSEGIYDIDLLLSSFPRYKEWFIAPTFGSRASYAKFSTSTFPLWNTDIRWLVVHSKGDTLVNLPQSEIMYKHLYNLHDSNRMSGCARVSKNEELDEGHNEILRGDEYVRIVSTFVMGLSTITN